MAVTKIEKIGDGWNYKTTGWPNPSIEFTDVYRVTVDNAADGGSVVESAFPAFGTQHPEKPQALLIEGNFDKSTTERFIWIARLRYSSAPNQVNDNPLNQPVKRRWRTVKVMKPVVKDRDGNHVLNKARVPYDPPLERPARHVILQFVRNEPTFDGSLAIQYLDRLNATTFSGAPAETVVSENIEAEESFWNGESYWIVTYEFEYNGDGWQPEILEQSLIEIGDDGGWHRIKDDDDEPVDQPVPIDSNGKKIAPSALPDAAISTKWNILEEKNFADFGLPV